MEHPAEFPLISEPEIVAVVELDRKVLEAKGRLVVLGDPEMAGHPQMNDQHAAVVEIEQEILAAPSGSGERVAGEASRNNVRRPLPDDPGEGADVDADDRPPDKEWRQRAADNFDFW